MSDSRHDLLLRIDDLTQNDTMSIPSTVDGALLLSIARVVSKIAAQPSMMVIIIKAHFLLLKLA